MNTLPNLLIICFNSAAEAPPIPPRPQNPCIPSPCGPNSQCLVKGDYPACSCLPGFVGSAPNCRPECISNGECATHLACINNKCKDPCPGSCGELAECRVVSHTARCLCPPGYSGDALIRCNVIQCEYIESSWNKSLRITCNQLLLWFFFSSSTYPDVPKSLWAFSLWS